MEARFPGSQETHHLQENREDVRTTILLVHQNTSTNLFVGMCEEKKR